MQQLCRNGCCNWLTFNIANLCSNHCNYHRTLIGHVGHWRSSLPSKVESKPVIVVRRQAGRWTHHREIGSASGEADLRCTRCNAMARCRFPWWWGGGIGGGDVTDSEAEVGIVSCNYWSQWRAHSEVGREPFVAIIIDGVVDSVAAATGSSRRRGTLWLLGRGGGGVGWGIKVGARRDGIDVGWNRGQIRGREGVCPESMVPQHMLILDSYICMI
jgi:hypothetical protein